MSDLNDYSIIIYRYKNFIDSGPWRGVCTLMKNKKQKEHTWAGFYTNNNKNYYSVYQTSFDVNILVDKNEMYEVIYKCK